MPSNPGRHPAERRSITHGFQVRGHEGYTIVGMYDDVRPSEVLIKIAKAGSALLSVRDALALSLSIGLQYGVQLKGLVNELTITRMEASGLSQNPEIRYASSLLDHSARWLGGEFIPSDSLRLATPSSDQNFFTSRDGTSGTDQAKTPSVLTGNH